MAEIGRKIYYEKSNGIIIMDMGERTGDVYETTFEEDCKTMPILSTIATDQLGIKQLQYGELREQFATCKGFKINPTTEEIEFINEVTQ